ncbi:arginase family protein [Kitasatospora sp. NBC_00240]|uniref:arginase family protein n=1 Tax=Kitasatospora sp. NBC_00240 TaxID=2903567 RepID=UPI0022583840|nr:arginase family protein [Kitasatospora sp. NBC_00240]MCX5207798.1 arginase family protein [Kitasatospora sp. NBC_00240]
MPRDLVVVGAPTSAGSYAPGQEAAPRVLRELGLIDRLRAAGRQVRDAGDGPLQIWAPDRQHPRAQNLAAAVRAVRTVADQVAAAMDQDADVLLIGGNCTIALGVMDALIRHDPDAGLLYVDRHFDLNTPVSSIDGALDWMGLAHGLDLPGAAEPLAAAFHRRPLLTPGQLYLLGMDPAAATPWEREQAQLLPLRWAPHTDLAAAPDTTVARALDALPPGALAVHIDVDVLDFTDAPLAESTDGRNSGPSLEAVAGVLDTACHDPRARVLSIGELNPARTAGHPETLTRFVACVTNALRATAAAA